MYIVVAWKLRSFSNFENRADGHISGAETGVRVATFRVGIYNRSVPRDKIFVSDVF